MSAAFIGLDLAKSVFQVYGVDAHGKVVVTKRLRRDAVLTFFSNLPWAWSGWRRAPGRISGSASAAEPPSWSKSNQDVTMDVDHVALAVLLRAAPLGHLTLPMWYLMSFRSSSWIRPTFGA